MRASMRSPALASASSSESAASPTSALSSSRRPEPTRQRFYRCPPRAPTVAFSPISAGSIFRFRSPGSAPPSSGGCRRWPLRGAGGSACAAVGLRVTAVMFTLLVTNYTPLLNGAAGLSLVPAPLQSLANPESAGYQWGYGVVALLLAFLTYMFVTRITNSPYGRTLRAMRDNDIVADSLGKNLRSLRTSSLVIGGAIAGLSGGGLGGFINLWDPQAWGYAETVVLFAAVIIGGLGNHGGAVLGAILVPVAFEEATRYIPPVPNNPNLIPALQWVVIGLLIVLFLWFRPQGILPERRRIILGKRAASAPPPEASDGEIAPRASRATAIEPARTEPVGAGPR